MSYASKLSGGSSKPKEEPRKQLNENNNNNTNQKRTLSRQSTAKGSASSMNHSNRDAYTRSPNSSSSEDVSMNPALLFIMMNFLGSKVQVTTKNGGVYEGIFHASSVTENDIGVAMKMAYKIEENGSNAAPFENLVIMGKDVLGISAFNLNVAAESKADQEHFLTDTAISGNKGDKERVLQRWDCEVDENPSLTLDNNVSSSVSWNQFEVNEKLFGVTTDYKEEIYTTVIDKSDPNFKQKERQAAQLAKEIESATTSNVHIAEERGVDIQGKELDEEDLYGAVIRDTSVATKPLNQKDSAGAYNTTTTTAASSSSSSSKYSGNMTDKQPSTSQSKPTGKSGSKFPELQKSKSVREAVPSQLSQENVKSKEALNKPKKPAENLKAQRVGEVAYMFKEFAMKEKEQLAIKKQQLLRKEKDGIINEFKSFSQSFKLNSPVPADLAQILSKPKKDEEETDEPSTSNTSNNNKTSNKNTSTSNSKLSKTNESTSTTKAESKKESVAPSKVSTGNTNANTTNAAPPKSVEELKSPSGDDNGKSSSKFKFNLMAEEFTPGSPTFSEGQQQPQQGKRFNNNINNNKNGGNRMHPQGKGNKHYQSRPGSQYGQKGGSTSAAPTTYPNMPVPPYAPYQAPMPGQPMIPAGVPIHIPPGGAVPTYFFPGAPVYPSGFVPMEQFVQFASPAMAPMMMTANSPMYITADMAAAQQQMQGGAVVVNAEEFIPENQDSSQQDETY